MPTGKPTKMKPCAVCGKLFLPEKPSTRICSEDHYINCPICGKSMLWNSTRKPEPCSKECRKEATKRHNLEKYGVEHPMQSKEVQEHHKQAMKSKYGVEFALQSDELKQKAIHTNQIKFGTSWALGNAEIHERSKATMVERYGAPTTLQSEVLKKKMQKTMESKYGYSSPMKVPKFLEKAKRTDLSRYGVENMMQNEDFLISAMKTRIENHGTLWTDEMKAKSRITWMGKYGIDNPSHSEVFMAKARETCMERYGVPYGCLTPGAQAVANRVSKTNLRFGEELKKIGLDIQYEFYLGGKLYDIHVPEYNILIEIDPTYTHNTFGNHWNQNGLYPEYHLKKTQIAENSGYRCIHVFDWDDWDKIVDMLRPKKTIYARDTKVFKLYKPACDEFLNEFHLQGTCKGQLLLLGLVYSGELVEVMTFGKSRYSRSHDIELLRLCTRSGYNVIGGASKLFKHAVKYYDINNVVSYCDRSKFSGDVYSKLGMTLIRTTPPQEVWSRGDQRITANLLRQRGYDQLFKTNYGKGTSNEILMLENGWLPVYDCGQYVYEYHK